MTHADAVRLLRPAVVAAGGTWADLGAGTGVFTRALAALVGPEGTVIAVDRDRRAVGALERSARELPATAAAIRAVAGDFLALDDILDLTGVRLDGVLFANALHFAPDAASVLAQAARSLGEGGRIVVVEYDARPASRWVPYPVSVRRLGDLAAEAGLPAPRTVAERPSDYGGVMYVAVIELRDR